MQREAAGRCEHFQDQFSIPRKVNCHQSLHIARSITRQIPRQITPHIARQISLYITRQITLQSTRYVSRQIIQCNHNYLVMVSWAT